MPLLYYLALVCITFYPYSDGRRPNRPSFDATLKSTFTKEAKSVYLYLPHAVKNLILLHKVIARFMFLYNRFPCSNMFFSKMVHVRITSIIFAVAVHKCVQKQKRHLSR